MEKELPINICGIPTTVHYHVEIPKDVSLKDQQTLDEITVYLQGITEGGPGCVTIINNRIKSIIRKHESSLVFEYVGTK